MGIGKRRMAFLLAAALAFTSIDGVSLMAGAEEVLLVEDEGQVLQQEGANQQDAGQGSSGGQASETDTVLQSEKTENLTTETTAETIMETDTDAGDGTSESGAAGETPETNTEPAETSEETMPETGAKADQTEPASGSEEEVLLPETQTEGNTDLPEVIQETDSGIQTDGPQIVEDGGLIIEEVTVLDESAELAAGTLPWDGAKVTPVTMDSPVEVAAGTSPSDLQWYSFTPDEAGEYVFSAVGSTATVHSISMYNADGSLLSGWTSRLKYSLTGGVTYFYSVMNNMDAYTVLVERPQSVTSASVEPEKTELINYLDSLWIGDVTLTYADGSTFVIDKNTTEDRYGNLLYVVFYLGEVQAGTCALNQPFSLVDAGTYQVELLYNGQPVSERYDITVVNPEEAVLPQISPQGETAVTSGTDMSDRIWYTFTPQKTGRYSFNVANGMSGLPPCEIVKMDSTGVVSASLSDTLESGVTYYLRFYGGLYDSLTGSYVYDFTLSVKEAVDIERAEIISGKTTFINGLENVINHNTKLRITYSDQSTREVTVPGSGITDGQGNNIYCTLKNTDEEAVPWFNTYEPGTYHLVFTCGGKELCRQTIQVVSIDSILKGTLYTGKNKIVSGQNTDNITWYSFTPEETSKYLFDFGTGYVPVSMTIRNGESWLWVQQTEKLKAGVTYYLSFFSIDGVERECSLTISKGAEILSAEVLSGDDTLISDLESFYTFNTKLLLTYSDGSTQELTVPAGYAIADGKGNTVSPRWEDQNGNTVSWNDVTSGQYTLVFECDGRELCRRPVNVITIDQASKGKLILGLNQIECSEAEPLSIYSFAPEWSGDYILEHSGDITIYQMTDSGLKYLRELYNGYAKISLEQGADYYITADGRYNDGDMWGEPTYTIDLLISYENVPERMELAAGYSGLTAIAGTSSVYNALMRENTAVKLYYSDGTSETRTWQEMMNSCSTKLYSESGEEVSLYTAAEPGSYELELIYQDASLRIPAEIRRVEDACAGTWDLEESLAVNTEEGDILYRLTPSAGGTYQLRSNEYLSGAKLYDSGLETADSASYRALKTIYGTAKKMDLEAGSTYYLYLPEGGKYSLTAELQSQKEITRLTASARREDYLADFERLTPDNFKTDITYSDGTVNTVYGNGTVQYTLQDEQENTYWFYRTLPAGNYTVTPRVTSGAAISQTDSTSVTVHALDVSSLPQVSEGETVKKLSGTSTADNLFRFVPESGDIYTYVCEDGSSGSVTAYAYTEGRWTTMKEWSMSAGETYVLKASGGSFAFSVQKENDIPPLPVLALGQAVSGTIPETAGYAEYAFTAPESGGYTLNVEGVVERAELRAESYTLTLENEPHTLIEGGSYVYRVYGVSGTEFTLTLEKTADKEISEVAILPEAFDLEYSMYGFGSYALATTGSVARIAYTDNSSWELPAYWENLGYIDYHGPISDGYGNELDWRSRKLGQDADGCQYEIAVRYRTEQDTEWTYHSENVTIPFVSAKADKQLKADIAASGTFNAGGKDYYQISVDQTGKYRFVIAEPELSENCEFQLYSANGSTIDGETNDIFYLQAGRTYYLRIFGGTDAAGTAYSLLMTRLKDLSSIEILSAPEQAYRRIGVLEEEVQLKIHYADGSEEILDGTRVLADGRSVKREYEQLDNTQARLTYTLEDCRVSTLISLAELSAAPQMTADGGKYSISFDNQEAGYQRYRYVMQVTPEYTGEYHLTTASGQPVWNVSAQIYDSNLFEISTAWSGLYLEAGRMYYIVADARSEDNLPLGQLTISLEMSGSHTCDWQPGDVLKAPTCLEEGEQEQICGICGATEVIILPALGHEFGEWRTEKEASETETGSKYQECSRCRERIYEIIPSTGTQDTIEEVRNTIADIVIEEGTDLSAEEKETVSQAIGSLTQIDNEELLAAEDSQILDTIEKLDELASGLDSVSETKYEVAAELQSQIGTPEVKGAALTAAAVSEEVSVEEDETLSVKVNLAVSENAYEELQGKTVAVDITMSVVKVNADGEVTETVQNNVQPSTPIQVTMQIPPEFRGKTFVLYHVSGTDRQEIGYTTDGSSITFATPSLSDFVLHLTDCGDGNHTWKAGQILKEATCTEYGRIADLCENCEQRRNEKRISMKEHEWETLTEKAATCSEDGYILQQCKNCQTEQKTTTAPATGAHAFTVVVDQNATCGAAGSQHRECSVCGYKEAATMVPATGAHTFTVVVDQSATCGAAGSQHRECSVCGYKEAATAIPAAGAHSFGAFAETKAATAVEEGVRTRTCTVCGAQEMEAIAKLPATIELSANKVVLKTGQSTKSFKVTEMADGDSVKSIVSSKNSVVKASGVTADGACKLKAGKKTGSAKLTITLASGLTKSVKVKVQKNAVRTTSIRNLQKKLTLSQKQKIKLMPELNPITSQDKITYSSSNKKVATVTSKGIVKGIKAGKAKITVKSGKKKFVCNVTVRK